MRQEGFWRSHETETVSGLPWPIANDAPWTGQLEFVARLLELQDAGQHASYRGWSNCRICGCPNGNVTYMFGGWSWPSGYSHYLIEHNVEPSADFKAFVLSSPTQDHD